MIKLIHSCQNVWPQVGLVALGFILCAAPLRAQQITRSPDPNQTLAQRWAWAEQHARKEYSRQGAWIGYSIQQMMSSHSFIGTMSFEDDCMYLKGKSLSELINGVPAPDSLLCGKKWRKAEAREMLKEIGFFFRFMPGRNDFAEIQMSTFSLSVDFENRPVLWLGRVAENESLSWLKQLYRGNLNAQAKAELIGVVGTHASSPERQAFLTEVLKSREDDDVRKQAAFYLGQKADRATIALLKETAQHDRAEDVRKQAVFALTQTKSEEAVAALVELVKQTSDFEVRKDALFWLGQTKSPQAASTLREVLREGEEDLQRHAVFVVTQLPKAESLPLLIEIVKRHRQSAIRKEGLFWLAQTHSEQAVAVLQEAVQQEDFEVQKQAVFAMTQLKKEQSVPLLIEVAQKHARQEVRKEALFWLAQSHHEKATPVLMNAAQKEEYEVQKHAIFALSQLPRAEGTPLLIDLAQTHPNRQLRKEAMFWLGQSDDPRAAEALIKIVRGK